MIVIGSKGFAKQILEGLEYYYRENEIFFFDLSPQPDKNKLFLGKYPVIKSLEKVTEYFNTKSNEFTLGINGTLQRKMTADKFIALGGKLTTVISPNSNIGKYDVKIGKGVNIAVGVIIENSVTIGDGTMINLQSAVCHDSSIGEYCEISTNVKITGKCTVGSFTSICMGAVLIPGTKVGENVVIGAGAVVTKDIGSNISVVGIPARQI